MLSSILHVSERFQSTYQIDKVEPMNHIDKIGLIGVAHPHSIAHLKTLRWIDQIVDIPIYDPDESAIRNAKEEIGDKIGEIYTDLDSLLNRTDVPIMFVCLRNDQTPDVLIKCADAAKHIIVEKPVATSAEAFKPALDTIEKAGLKMTVCFQNRYHPMVQEIFNLIGEGILGTPMSIEMRMITSQVRFRDPDHWLFQKELSGGGILSWLGCHYLDMACYFMRDRISEVSAIVATNSGESIDVEDTASLSFRFSSGSVGSLHAGYMLPFSGSGYMGPSYDTYIAIRGTKGNIVWNPFEMEKPLTAESTIVAWETSPHRVFHHQLPACDAYGGIHGVKFVTDFLDTIASEKQPAVSGNDMMHVLEILDAAYESDATGRRINI